MRKLKQILGWVIVIAVAVAVGGWLVSLFSDNKEQLVFNTVKAELMDMRSGRRYDYQLRRGRGWQ